MEQSEFASPAVWLNRLKTGAYERRKYLVGKRKKIAIEKVKGKLIFDTLKCQCASALVNFNAELELLQYHTCITTQ